MKPVGLSASLSIYLDAMRLFAAILVFIGHANSIFFGFQLRFVFGQAANAVAIFFVLSGFVISYVVARKEESWRSYALARASRIYSVALIALLITFIADQIGLAIAPAAYKALNDRLQFMHEDSFSAACSYILFVNQFWFTHIVFGSNEPFWSLGFEVWYYVVFGFVCFMSGRLRFIALILWALVCGPKILMYLPLWMVGVFTYRVISTESIHLNRFVGFAVFSLSLSVYYIFARFFAGVGHMYEPYSLYQESINFVYYTGIGVAISLNIIGFNIISRGVQVFPKSIAASIRWLAGASFTLYLTHLPLLVLFSAILPASKEDYVLRISICAAVLLLVLVLAELGERRKSIFQALFGQLLMPRPA
jgi:peptidoglycan/LPS O-acetylase OafA/YrhL